MPRSPQLIYDMIEQKIAGSKAMVIDTETDGTDWRVNRICGYALAFGPAPDDSYYLPTKHKGGGNMDPAKVVGCIKAGLKRNPTIATRWFSASFDLKMLEQDGIHYTDFQGTYEDGQINQYLIDERLGSFSLARCCEFMKVQAKKGEALYAYLASVFGGEPNRDQMANFHKLAGNDPMAVEYGVGDGTSTWQLIDAQQRDLDEQELRDVWRIECRLIRTLHRMTLRGIRVDEAHLERVIALVRKKRVEAKRALPDWLNVRSGKDMVRYFEGAGITDWPLTEKGNPSFPENWLETNEPGKLIVTDRKLRTLEDTYLTPLKAKHLWNGRVHTTFNQTRGEEFGTITGRLSSNDPNLQAVHKRDDLMGSIYRYIFVPDEGLEMGTADYRQIEPCLLAHYGQVKVLLDGYLSDPPIDAHTAVANVTGMDRESAKRLNQALITGAGLRKAIIMLRAPSKDYPHGRSAADAQQIYNGYFQQMPEIKDLQRRAANVMTARGYVRSLLGRRARLEDYRFAYKTVNRILQCGNADVMKKAMVDMDAYYESNDDVVHMLLTIHDDLVQQWAKEHEAVYRGGLEIMQDFGPGKSVHVDVPIRVDAKTGRNWAEATYGEKKVRENWQKMGGKYVP